jgi:hypothetical protein
VTCREALSVVAGRLRPSLLVDLKPRPCRTGHTDAAVALALRTGRQRFARIDAPSVMPLSGLSLCQVR